MFGRKRRSREPEPIDIEARLSILDLRASARQAAAAPAVPEAGSPASQQQPAASVLEPTPLEPTPLEPSYADVALPQVIDLTDPAQPEYAAAVERADDPAERPAHGEGEQHA